MSPDFHSTSNRAPDLAPESALDASFLYQVPGIAQKLDLSIWATAHHPKFRQMLIWLPGCRAGLVKFLGAG